MGNSQQASLPANQTHSHQPYHPAGFPQAPHSRNGVLYGPQQPVQPRVLCNPEYKVLPERAPGQKLRLTDNGFILHGGGTLSGKAREGTSPPPPPPVDPEFQRLLRQRAEKMDEQSYQRDGHRGRVTPSDSFIGDDGGEGAFSRKFHRKKTKAPPPPPSSSPPPSDRTLLRTNSFQEAVGMGSNGGLVRVQPWQQRHDGRLVMASPVTSSMEKIIERREIVVQHETRMYETRADTLPWSPRNRESMGPEHMSLPREQDSCSPLPPPWGHQRNDVTSSHERRFYKQPSENGRKLSQSELHLNGHTPRNKYQMPLSDREAERRQRAKSMDSLQAALENERQRRLGPGNLRMSIDNLHNGGQGIPADILHASHLERSYNLTRQSRENLVVNGHNHENDSRQSEIRRPSSRQDDYHPDVLKTSSLQRGISPGKYRQEFRKEYDDQKSHVYRATSPSPGRGDVPLRDESDPRRDSSIPRQYYYGEVMTMDNRGRGRSPAERGQSELRAHQRSGSSSNLSQQVRYDGRSNGHRDLEDLRLSPLGKGYDNSRRTTDIQRPESRSSNQRSNKEFTQKDLSEKGVDSARHVPRMREDSKPVSRGRQRNSYAFEDPRYRHEAKAALRDSTPTKKKGSPEISSEDEMDISMQLRPTLPKRTPAIPRFSPTQAWRALNLDHITHGQRGSDRSSEDGDVCEDRIHRVTRPVAPPRSGNERSADSGISQDAGSPGLLATDIEFVGPPDRRSDHNKTASPPPLLLTPDLEPHSLDTEVTEPGISPVEHKRSTWTPEEDLASDFDGGSSEQPDPPVSYTPVMVKTQPRLTSIKSMFSVNKSSSDQEEIVEKKTSRNKKGKSKIVDPTVPHTFNSMRKLKRSLSGVLGTHAATPSRNIGKIGEETQQNVDENWSFSRSLPNSLHNGHEGEVLRPQTKSPEFVGQFRMRRAESGPIHPSPTFLGLQSRVMSVDCLNAPSHSSHQMRSLSEMASRTRYSTSEHIIYLPEYDAKKIVLQEEPEPTSLPIPEMSGHVQHSDSKKKGKKFKYQSTVRQNERKRLEQKLSQEVAQKEKLREREKLLVNKVEEEFQRKREREKASICHQLKVLSSSSSASPSQDYHDNSPLDSDVTPPPPLMTASQLSLFHDDPMSSSSSPLSSQPTSDGFINGKPHVKLEKQDSGFFGGISKWMRRQQRLEEQTQTQVHEGLSNTHPERPHSSLQQSYNGVSGDPSAIDDARHHILTAAKFSSGIIPPDAQHPPGLGSADERNAYLFTKVDVSKTNGQYWQEEFASSNASALPNSPVAQVHRSSSGRAVESRAEVKQQHQTRSHLQQVDASLPAGPSSGSSMDESTTSSISAPGGLFEPRRPASSAHNHEPPGLARLQNDGGRRVRRPRSSIEDSERSSDAEDEDETSGEGGKSSRHHSRYRSPDTGRKGHADHSDPLTNKRSRHRHGAKKQKDAKVNGHGENHWDESANNRRMLPSDKSTITG